jgi:uncharacterized protein (DUF2141 family)
MVDLFFRKRQPDKTRKKQEVIMSIKKNKIWIIIPCLVLCCIANAHAADSRGTLIIDVTGLADSQGYAMVAVYGSEKAYKEGAPVVAKAVITIFENKARAVFSYLAYGHYAVAVFHDQNANGEIDKNAMGIPKESYGHSNNVRGLFGPPSFDKAKVELASPEKQIEIRLD